MASSSSRSSSHKSSSRINLARLVFLISIAVLTSYLYSGFTSELSTYKAYRASRKVLSSVSSLALGTSTAVSTTVSRGVVVKTTTAVDTATPIATATATAGKSVEHEEREDKMTGVARIPVRLSLLPLHILITSIVATPATNSKSHRMTSFSSYPQTHPTTSSSSLT